MNLVFQFPDLQSFLSMSGHGPYVWGCYAITFVGLIFLAVEPRLQRKKFIKQQQRVQVLRNAQLDSIEQNAIKEKTEV